MHKLILGKRNAAARQKIFICATALSEKVGLDPALASGLKVQEKDVAVKALKELEAVALLLSELCKASGIEFAESETEPVADAGESSSEGDLDKGIQGTDGPGDPSSDGDAGETVPVTDETLTGTGSQDGEFGEGLPPVSLGEEPEAAPE